MREGLQETPTVVRLGLSGSLQRTRRSTNPIENLNGSVQRHTRNFKRWRGGEMIQRWVSAALLDAERRLRRVRMAGARSRCRALESEREATTAKLLEAECADVDLNDAARKEAVIQAELESLQRRLAEAAEARSRARDAFEGLGGSDAAARAAADREDALADLRNIAARYVRAKGSALLLEWVIERFRRERQAPLLRRAGELFDTLTGGSFTGLGVEFDNQDRPCLVGLRPNGEEVPVSGLSSGTVDQLYLALRLGAVEEYLDKAHVLPFIADDLLVHFDDKRAAAGLKVLERLSLNTQVLVFTHHRHLVDIARRTLGASCHVVDLASGQARMPRKAA